MANKVLIVGHGSRSEQAVEEFYSFVHALEERVKQKAGICFLELAEPDMAEGLSRCAEEAGKGGEVHVLPLFLGRANHQKNDVAAAIQWAQAQFPDVHFHQGTPLEPHAKLVELAHLRVDEAMAASGVGIKNTAILFAARGSSDPESNGEIARTVRIFYEAGKYSLVELAFQAVAQPSLAEGLQRCKRLGAEQVVVLPYILFSGLVEDDIRLVSHNVGQELGTQVIFANHLGVHPLLIDVAEQRLIELLQGKATMTCDVCKYRFPIAPYQKQVGQPQVTHHLHGGEHHSH